MHVLLLPVVLLLILRNGSSQSGVGLTCAGTNTSYASGNKFPASNHSNGWIVSAVAVNPLVKDSAPLKLTIWLLAGFLCLHFISACINWSTGWFVVTSQRILLVSGAPDRRARNMPLEDVKHLTFRRSRGGRAFGYGTFIFDIGGSPRIRIEYIPYPEQLYLEVNGLVFRDREEDFD